MAKGARLKAMRLRRQKGPPKLEPKPKKEIKKYEPKRSGATKAKDEPVSAKGSRQPRHDPVPPRRAEPRAGSERSGNVAGSGTQAGGDGTDHKVAGGGVVRGPPRKAEGKGRPTQAEVAAFYKGTPQATVRDLERAFRGRVSVNWLVKIHKENRA